eukprot:98435_1
MCMSVSLHISVSQQIAKSKFGAPKERQFKEHQVIKRYQVISNSIEDMKRNKLEVVVKPHPLSDSPHLDDWRDIQGVQTIGEHLRRVFHSMGCGVKKVKSFTDKMFITLTDSASYHRALKPVSTTPTLVIIPSNVSLEDLFTHQRFLHTQCLKIMEQTKQVKESQDLILQRFQDLQDALLEDTEYDDEYEPEGYMEEHAEDRYTYDEAYDDIEEDVETEYTYESYEEPYDDIDEYVEDEYTYDEPYDDIEEYTEDWYTYDEPYDDVYDVSYEKSHI